MRLREYNSADELENIKELYIIAFPEEERKPFELMAERIGSGVEMLGIENDYGEFLGLAVMLVHGNVALLDYFAVMPELRGKSVGSQSLAMLKEKYSGKCFLIEIEDTEEECENHADRVRRKAFYLRCGMVEMPYRVWFYGTKMQVLTGGDVIGFEEHIKVYEAVLGSSVAERILLA